MKKWFGLLVCFAIPIFGQQVSKPTDSIQITAVVIQDDQIPLWVVSYTADTQSQFRKIVVQNKTGKQINEFEIAWVALVPAGCSQVSENEGVPLDRRSLSLDVTISPSETKSLEAYAVPHRKFTALANNKKAAAIDVQFAVIHVTFADGTTWSRPSEDPVFSVPELQFNGKNCSGGHLLKQTSSCVSTATEGSTAISLPAAVR
jgi:hypothetical protein